jgi:hypothetical protein
MLNWFLAGIHILLSLQPILGLCGRKPLDFTSIVTLGKATVILDWTTSGIKFSVLFIWQGVSNEKIDQEKNI